MAERRGSAVVAIVVTCLLAVTLQCKAAIFVVGDSAGWSNTTAGWEKGKTFKAGDTLVFNYARGKHNVVVVNKAGYDACHASPSDKVYTSGNDLVNLVKGPNYFICGFPGHCVNNMKIQISAS